MDMKSFTEKSQAAVVEAQDLALRLGHQQVDADHLALALVRQEGGLVPRLLEKAGVSAGEYGLALEQELKKLPSVSGPGTDAGQLSISNRMRQILIRAHDAATRMKDEFVSVEHIFCELAAEPAATPVGRVNKIFNVTRERVLSAMTEVRGNQRVTSRNPEETYEALDKFGR
ncbi:MAG: type VI secretion system ATPase TssH, partial [Desulfovibrio sp.]|nr:type VI secretion system ATPase TssH [Desulfovibrio sp.]